MKTLSITTVATLVFLSSSLFAQKKITDDFTKTKRGLWYKIVVDAKKPKGKIGDIIKLNAVYSTQRDSILFSSVKEGMGPIQYNISEPTFNGDAMEGFAMLGEGDSAIFLMPTDSTFKGQEMPPFAKQGEFIKVSVRVLALMNKEEYEKQKAAEAKTQTDMESKTIEEYLAKNNIKAQRTASGLYYVIEKQGEGTKAVAGKTVSVNYTGKLLDGKVFDSSLKPGRTPLSFLLGGGTMIKGFDEGIALLNVGGKETLYIPSTMGWGSRGAGADIPPNSITIFDIELVEVK